MLSEMKIKKDLKRYVPQCTFSVERNETGALKVTIISGPDVFSDLIGECGYASINVHHASDYAECGELLGQILNVITTGYPDEYFSLYQLEDSVILSVGSPQQPYRTSTTSERNMNNIGRFFHLFCWAMVVSIFFVGTVVAFTGGYGLYAYLMLVVTVVITAAFVVYAFFDNYIHSGSEKNE